MTELRKTKLIMNHRIAAQEQEDEVNESHKDEVLILNQRKNHNHYFVNPKPIDTYITYLLVSACEQKIINQLNHLVLKDL